MLCYSQTIYILFRVIWLPTNQCITNNIFVTQKGNINSGSFLIFFLYLCVFFLVFHFLENHIVVVHCWGAHFILIWINELQYLRFHLIEMIRSVLFKLLFVTSMEWFIKCAQNDLFHITRFTTDYFENGLHRCYGGSVGHVFSSLRMANYKDPYAHAADLFNGTGSYGNGGAMRIAPAALYGLRYPKREFEVSCPSVNYSLYFMNCNCLYTQKLYFRTNREFITNCNFLKPGGCT